MSFSRLNAVFIGAKKGEDSPFKTIAWSKEKEDSLKGEISVEKSSRLFRKAFSVSGKVEKATLSICGLGFYEVYINGVKPDVNRVLSPVVSDYFLLTRYDVYDVTAFINEGKNAIAAEVGPGWYAGTPEFWGWQQFWYGNCRLAARLEIVTAKGEMVVLTDESWKTAKGAITESCVYNGEKWDFNLSQSGWTGADFDDGSWENAEIVESPTENLVESIVPPERIIRTLSPVKTWTTLDGKYAFDFGENGAGIPRVVVLGKKGDVVRLEHAEYISADGSLDKKTINRAKSVDEYILADDKPTVCTLKFSWHGYQYMTVETPPDVKIISAEKCVVHTDVKIIGEFKCGNSAINKLHEGYVRTELACLQGVPVDCPQRDERKAWLGDAHVTSEMCLYNFDMRDFYVSFLEDMKTGRPKDTKVVSFLCPCYNVESTKVGEERTSIDWNLAYPVILWEHYKRYGDKNTLVHHYEVLKEHTGYYVKQLKDGFIPPCWFGDWLTFDYPENTVNRVAFAVGPDYHRQNPPYAATMFFCVTLEILISVAEILGNKEDAEYYSDLLFKSKKAILNKYYDFEKGILGGGGQFLQAYALYARIVPDKDREKVFSNLLSALEETKYHLLCGIFGTRVLFDVLCDFNRRDIVYKILSQNGYMCPQHFLEGGRTTLTESYDWDGSGCHCMWASPDASLYKVFGGINVDRTKTPAVEISPYFVKELGFVNCKQKIEEGEISVKWKYLEKGVSLDVSTPVESTLVLPNGKTEILPVGNYNFIIEE